MPSLIHSTLIWLLLLVFANASSAVENLTVEQWREDVRYLAKEFPERHKNLFHTMSRQEFEFAISSLDKRIPELQRHEVIVEIARIVALVRDGHTRIRLGEPPTGFHFLPLKLFLYTDGLFVQKAPPEYASLVGGRITMIGSVTAEEAMRRVAEIIQRDNEWTIKSLLPVVLIQPEILHAFKITDNLSNVNLTVEKSGKITRQLIKPVAEPKFLMEPQGDWVDARVLTKPEPLYLRNPTNLYWYEYLEDSQLLYIQYNGVANKPDEPIAKFFAGLMAFTNEHPVEKVVLDLRFNGGGNNQLNKPIILEFIKAVDINQKGKLFTIIGRGTFSAAMNCVNQLEKWTNTTFVGEPTGASPNHYGDTTPIKLPNSGLVVHASTLWWQDMDPRDTRKWRSPDIAAELSSNDYRNGRDPALEAILKSQAEPSLIEMLNDFFKQNKVDEARKYYQAFKKNPRHKFVETESDINRLGYLQLQKNLIDRAIEVFQWNVEDYPKSWNVYDSLAEAYEARGDKELAKKNYKKALELNPKSPTTIAALQRLSESK